jgi:hypothetical protein
MKTTVDIPDELFREAKATAARTGFKLKDLVADGLRLVLMQPKPQGRRVKFPLIPRNSGTPRLTLAEVTRIDTAEDSELANVHARTRRR